MIGLLLAVPDCAQETDIVAGAPGHGLQVKRRCVDAADLLAAAAADPATAVVLSAALPRLSRDVVDRLGAASGRPVVGLVTNDEADERLVGLGVTQVIRTGPGAAATLMALHDVLSGATAVMRHEEPGVWATGRWPSRRGTIVVVWGPMGAPGRTTVAIGVAESLAESERRVCVVDADTYAPSVAMALGVIEDSSGLLVACRHADNGSLTAPTLAGLSRRVGRKLHLLGGLTVPERWPDLRPTALERLWDTCRETYDVTVIDIGFCVEDADGSATWSRQRNAAALTALAAADRVIAVADGSGAGAARLAAAWPAISTRLPATTTTVVRNRARGGGREWLEALRSCGITADVHPVPADERAVTACWERGRSLGEGAPRSRIRRSLVELAGVAVSG